MARLREEIAADIVKAVVQARGVALSSMSNPGPYLNEYLSDGAVEELYKAVYYVVENPDYEEEE